MKFSSSILFAVFITGVAVAFFMLFYKPATKEITKLKQDIGVGRKRSYEEHLISQILSETTEEVELLHGRIEELKSNLLPLEKDHLFFNDLTLLMKEFKMEKTSINPRGRQKRQPFDVLIIDMKMRSAFETFYNFLQAMEDYSYAIRIENLRIVTDIRSEGKFDVQMTVSAPLNNM